MLVARVHWFFHSIGTVLFYALGISLVAVGIHGAMRVPDDLFLDEPEVRQRWRHQPHCLCHRMFSLMNTNNELS